MARMLSQFSVRTNAYRKRFFEPGMTAIAFFRPNVEFK